jgi:hypothetical protein
MYKKIISLVLIMSFVFALADELSQNNNYELGKIEGKRDGQAAANPWWALSGVGGVVVGLAFADYIILAGTSCAMGIAVAYFVPGNVPTEKIIGKPADYVKAYTEAYIKAKRWTQVFYSGSVVVSAGLGMIIGITLAVLFPGYVID